LSQTPKMKAVENCSIYIFSVDKISCAVQNIREKTSQSLSNKQRLTESEFQFKAFIFRARFFQNYYELAPTLNTKVEALCTIYNFTSYGFLRVAQNWRVMAD